MASGLSRVTVVAPHSRVDLALPSDVSLADLLPTVLRYAGTDLADDGAARHGWTLSRLGGLVLDSSHTPAQLNVRDGELLYLRPRGDDAPPAVFDDVVDAVATAAQERAGRWDPAATRAFGLTLAVLALLGGAAIALLAGPPQLAGGLVSLGVAAALLVASLVLARVAGNTWAATTFGLVAVAYAGVGGLLALAGDRPLGQLGWAHLLVAATAAALATALAAVAVAAAGPVFLCAGVCAVAVLVTATIGEVSGTSVASAAPITAVGALATLPLLPMIAYRLAQLPVPSVPTVRESLRQDDQAVDGVRVLEQADRADAFIAGMLSALAVIGAGAAVAVCTAGPAGLATSTVLGLLMVARARWFLGRAQRLPLLAGGAVALGAAAVGAFLTAGPELRLTGVLGSVLAAAGVSTGFALAGGRRPTSPMWGRALDVAEIVLILVLVPLAIWVSGLYAWIRAIRG